MCGIFALFSKTPLTDELIRLGRAGMAALEHRGPDACGEFVDRDRGVFLGHQRLKIIDLSENAAQPMGKSGLTIAYNGEFYGFKSVKRALEEKGERFFSESDTEVVLSAWRHWGPGAVDRLDGMFAFVLWDGAEGWLVTDHFGEKMLYAATTQWGLAVSSELEALRRILSSAPRFDADLIDEFLALGYVSAPRTFYPDIVKLPPASRFRVRDGEVRSRDRYWTPPAPEPGRGAVQPIADASLDRIQAALVESVSRRLIADVPLCLLLSSGVDSSLIAGVVSRDLHATVQCLTIDAPAGNAQDESVPAARIASHLGLPHRVVAQEPFLDRVGPADLLHLFGQPNDNAGIVSVIAVAAAARQQDFVVGLTGFGGDEIFRGYQKQTFAWANRGLYARPAWARQLLGRVLHASHSRSSRVRAFEALFAIPDSLRYLALKNNPAIAWLRQLPGFDAWAAARFADDRPFHDQVARFEITDVLPGSQLPAADVGAMSRGVELRTPFLDRRLIDTVAEFDPRALLAFGRKSVLRRLQARYLPEELLRTGKVGFVYPVHSVLADRPVPSALPVAVAPGWIQSLWERRGVAEFQRLALRLALLEEFAANHGRP